MQKIKDVQTISTINDCKIMKIWGDFLCFLYNNLC